VHPVEQVDGFERGAVPRAGPDEGIVVEGGGCWDSGEEGEGVGESPGVGAGEGFEEVGG